MILIVEKKTFVNAIQIATRFAERKQVGLSVLGGVMVAADTNTITLRATNLETNIEINIPGTVKTKGVVVLPAAILRDITSSLQGMGEVTLEHSGETLVLRSGDSKSTLKTLPSDDFPSFPVLEKTKIKHAFPGALLRTSITSVAACASTSSVRPELAAVYLSAEGGILKSVATDSFRLAEKKVSGADALPPFSLLIPARNALDIAQTIPDGQVTLSADEHTASFAWEGGDVGTRLVAASYPDYAQIIPKSFSAEATVLRKDLEAALKRAAIFSDAFQKIRLSFDPKRNRLSLAARNADLGESSEVLSAAVQGDAIELSFNHRYLSAPLPGLVSESITLSASGVGRPLVIRGVGDATYLYLVMPMNQ